MPMSKIFIAALTILCAVSVSGAPSAGAQMDKDGVIISNSLSNNRIQAITQDRQGHIWIGTFRGLNKYDSHEYHQYFCGGDDSSGLPDNQISSIFTDKSGKLWVGTVNGICRYQDDDTFLKIPIYGVRSYNVTQILESRSGRIIINTADALSVYKPESDCFESRLTVYSNDWEYITRAFISPDDRLWVAGDRLYCYDMDSFKLEGSYPMPPPGTVNSSCMTQDGNIWMSTNEGICIFSTAYECYLPLPASISNDRKLKSTSISHMFSCSSHLFLVSDSDGVFAYCLSDKSLLHQSSPDFGFDIPDFKLNAVFEDADRNIWWCSYDQGYRVSYAYKERFGNKALNSAFHGKSVTSMDIDGEGIYISTLRDGIFRYDISDGRITKMSGVPGIDERYRHYITSLKAGKDNLLWIGTFMKVILCRRTGGELRQLASWDCPYALCMIRDKEENIWVGTGSGYILRISRDGSRADKIKLGIPDKAYTFIGGLEILPSGNIIAGAFRDGLYEIDSRTLEAKKIAIKETDLESCIRRSIFIPSAMRADRDGNIWIGTVANGLLRFEPGSGTLSPMPGTPCDDICSIEEDLQGNLWVSTQFGLAKYDRTVRHFINLFEADGIGGNQFYDRASCMTPGGQLAFGGTHGITLFDPVNVISNRNVPLMFETLKVHNRIISPSPGGCISKALVFNPDVGLKYSQNSFGISFTAIDYSEFERVHYSYMLEGFDRFWIDANNNREANYANIPPGKYTFRVRITDIDQTEIITENSLKISVAAPAYRSWWAYLIYMAAVSGIICIIAAYRKRLSDEKKAKEKAAMEREQEKKVNRMNMSFFANISHEFRTPLTMISAPVAQLADNPSIDDEGKRLLDIVRRNIARMLRLVNQLLDFNKLENDTLRLKVRQSDIVGLLNYLVAIFRVNAEEKGISLVTWGIEDSLTAWVDEDKVDKICFNLLSNAMKFTPSGGKIEISLDFIARDEAAAIAGLTGNDTDTRYVKITVKDTGPGIPEAELEKIFERYYQLENNVRGAYNWGTGIGLYYARTLAGMHHGWLKAANRKDIQGAEFTLVLPASASSYSPDETDSGQDSVPVRRNAVRYKEIPDDHVSSQVSHSVLVVDDDADVIRYMKELLSPHYKVLYRYDADSAFMVLKEDAPDIVISDVVMPGKTGYDLCRQIKGSLQLSHIPVILLTAKANVDDQVTGLDCGADAYVTKPFEPQYLMALINSQIKNREKIKSMLSQATEVTAIDENVLSEQDEAFMKELYELMEKELSNAELDVTGMTERLHISRTKFYYKVKGLTGENPSVFFKRYKLNRASQLLKGHKYNISEIADMTGFSTLSHFSTSFKKQFGVTPSEYQK